MVGSNECLGCCSRKFYVNFNGFPFRKIVTGGIKAGSWTDVSNSNLQYRNPQFRGIGNERSYVSGAAGILDEDAGLQTIPIWP